MQRFMRYSLIFLLFTVLNTGATPSRPCHILILGDSITAGFGLSPSEAYPALLQNMITLREWPFEVINGGLSGETTAGGLRRVVWMLQTPVEVFILALGGNDALRGIDPDATRENLIKIIQKVKTAFPDAMTFIAGMEAPPNMGEPYRQAFRDAFALAAQKTDSIYIPFLLEGVAAEPALNLEDGIHPNAEGHKKIAGHLWQYLEPVLKDLMRSKRCPVTTENPGR